MIIDECKCSEYAEKISQIACWEFDTKTKQVFWSDQVFRILGFSKNQVKDKRHTFRSLILKEDLPIYKEKIKELIQTEKPVEFMLRIKNKAGKTTHCLIKSRIIKEKKQKNIIGTIQDLTSLIEAKLSLKKEKETAEKENIAKSYFLAQASHDLHQPLQALKIFAYNLLGENLSSKQKKIAEQINASSKNLESLLNNFLDISKLDSGGFENHREKFNIGELLEKVYLEFKEIASCHKINFKFINCKAKITSDPVLIERILRNLISNAIKYTKDKIIIGCKREKDTIKIMVMDNGVGISKKELPYVFDEYFQSGRIKNNRRYGAGLGLNIVKRIALIINTKVTIKSEPNKGSAFTVEIPLK